ncbi:MAG: YebC/PmpR family DNA-binding transcriptional regulator [Candidatus Yanofskybacteria bacterium]|nr:YebC/PmpR family DNA-binding transcriptional regulator [Candidatus Yanofskybacteria bacterium]
MSGHSKWSQIKHRKGAADQKKGQVFSKLANKITIAARSGIDPASNYKLQSVIEEARAANMPKDNIERAIKQAGDKDSTAINEILIQAMGPGGIAIAIEGVTDNSNRTINEIKKILSENGAKMVPEGSLSWAFSHGWVPITPIELGDKNQRDKIEGLLGLLAEHDDVEKVHTNLKSG